MRDASRYDFFGGTLHVADLDVDGAPDLIIGAGWTDGPDGSREIAGAAHVLLGPLDSSGGGPVADAGGPYVATCDEALTNGCDFLPFPFTLDGSGSRGCDPIVDWSWSISCSGLAFLQDGEVVDACLDPRCGRPCFLMLTVTDSGGLTASDVTTVELVDDEPPELRGVPADATARCDDDLSPPVVVAVDDCLLPPVVTLDETQLDGPCPDTRELVRTWTATDACGNATSETSRLAVVDDVAPSLADVPEDLAVPCDGVPPPPAVTASDACDPDPSVSFEEERIEGSCPGEWTLVRTWTATDRCGNEAIETRSVVVSDVIPPSLVGVPPDATVECDAIPPPAPVTATDTCDPDPSVSFEEVRMDGRCDGEWTLVRTWSAVDHCGNEASAVQRIEVIDTTPPVVTPSEDVIDCLWAPHHGFACLGVDDIAPAITDACSEIVTWRFGPCASDQADDAQGTGDGHTAPDCLVSDEGDSVCLRAERDGTDRDGRTYTVTVIATDDCGNESEPVAVGTVHVAHDRRDRMPCRSASAR